jgi:SAM-dependent methyltransferase
VKQAVKGLLRPLGLLGVARGLRDRLRASRAWRRNARFMAEAGGLDGLPVPPAHLILLVTGTADLEWYVEGGRRAAVSLKSLLERNRVDPARLRAILDFGCGCGRVTRHWRGLPAEVFGADYNRHLVDWCKKNLAFARFAPNDLKPPLPHPDGRFDFVYALSVFTHLPEALQRAWMEDLARVIQPGGHLAVSLHGKRYLGDLNESERRAFESGRLVVRQADSPGSNVCGAYHPPDYVKHTLVAGLFDVVDFAPEGATGNPHQDLYLLRRR